VRCLLSNVVMHVGCDAFCDLGLIDGLCFLSLL